MKKRAGNIIRDLKSLESRSLSSLKKKQQNTYDKLVVLKEDYESKLQNFESEFQAQRKEQIDNLKSEISEMEFVSDSELNKLKRLYQKNFAKAKDTGVNFLLN